MDKKPDNSQSLSAAITKAASKQTYYTIRFFVDRGLAGGAYLAYGYFRWLDDVIDAEANLGPERIALVQRQKSLLEACYRGEVPEGLCREENMLVDLVHSDTEENSGLQTYLRNMMDVMIFDAGRRGRYISQAELNEYSRKLATAVTEAIHYFIGHNEPTPNHEARYAAVTAAHIIHMLRDAIEDGDAGYFNIAREHLQRHRVSLQDVESHAYREWVCGRVQLARRYFKAGRECIARVRNLRCRLAGYAYIARFEWMLHTIERDHYCLRSEYQERKGLRAGLWMVWSTLVSLLASPWKRTESRSLAVQPVRAKDL